ncbi:VUT family protein [Actinophytocola sp. KF-1]
MPGSMALAGYLLSVVAANVASVHWSVFAVAGLLIPAGTLFAGMTLTARDVIHDAMGTRWVAVDMAVGAGLSAVLASPGVAVASVAAFTVSELVDTLVYTWLRHRHRLIAVAVSNVAGLVTDSLLFVPLAFGSFAPVPGQVAGKAAATGLALVALHFGHRRAVARR